MTRTYLSLFAVVLVLSLTCPAIVQPQDKSKNKSGGSIAGRVTAGNKALAGVTVTVSMSGDALWGAGLTLKATTDDDGKFLISKLRVGTYYVWPFVPGFVVSEATGVYPQGKAVTVEEGETAADINFTVARGAVITGKVIDSARRPIIDERVRVLPVDPNLQRLVGSVYPSINDIRTDDRGIYRVYGLPAGKYKVSIGDQFAAFTSTRGRRFYPQTFHPDVTEEAKAEVVEVGEGGQATNVDITVTRSMTGFSVNGHFVDAENGQAVASISFDLAIMIDGRIEGFMGHTGVSAGNGAFRIDNLPPGRYAMSISSEAEGGYSGDSAAFDVTDSDVTELEVKVHRGSTISGNVVIEGADDKLVWARVSQVRMQAFVSFEGTGMGIAIESKIKPDGSFQIGPLRTGTTHFSLSPLDRNAPMEFFILGIDLNGVDKSHGITLKPGENISGLRIILGYGTASIRGTVRLDGGTSSYIGATLVRPGSGLTIAQTQVDARGRFTFDHVPAGNYEVVVSAYTLGTGRPPTARQPVVASDGVVTEVSLSLNLNPGPSPGP